jgi:hypothetical protein
MSRKYSELRFNHFIKGEDNILFASARYEGRILNFLIGPGSVREQAGYNWLYLSQDEARSVCQRAEQSIQDTPVYRLKNLELN